jgi:methionyl-tRNA formyltransferase
MASRRHGDEILALLGLPDARVFDGSRLAEPEVLASIEALRPEIGVSILFGYLLRRPMLDLLPAGCVNLHPALLPYNRGAYPNVWSIVDQTPAGATLHYVDEGVDTGDIITQRAVEVDVTDTGATLYARLEKAALELFRETWPLLSSGEAGRTPQNHGDGTSHRVRDVETIDEISLDQMYTARSIIDLLRARTFPPHRGAYFRHGGGKVYLELNLRYVPHEEPLS